MKCTLFIALFLIVNWNSQVVAKDLTYEIVYAPYSLNEFPRIGSLHEHPWRPDKLIFENQEANLKEDCYQEEDLTICNGTIRNLEFFNYKGILVRFSGYGSISLNFSVDDSPYLKTAIHARAVQQKNRLDFNQRIKSDTGLFPREEGHMTFTIHEAPLIGGVILNKKTGASVKLACVENYFEACRVFQIIKETNAGRFQVNNQSYELEDLASLKSFKGKVSIQGEWILPLTSATMSCAVPLFLPITLPLDVLLLPVTGPIALIKRSHARQAIETLFNFKETKTIKVEKHNFEIIEEIFEALEN